MAFSVTPTSGEAPYTFTAEFNNQKLIDGVRYILQFRYSEGVGLCPSLGISNNIFVGIAPLLETGSYVTNAVIPIGSCRAYTLSIKDNVNNVTYNNVTVTVDNV